MDREGQVRLPADIRQALHLSGGERFDVTARSDGSIELRPRRVTVEGLLALRRRVAGTTSVQEMDEAIAAAVAPEIQAPSKK